MGRKCKEGGMNNKLLVQKDEDDGRSDTHKHYVGLRI